MEQKKTRGTTMRIDDALCNEKHKAIDEKLAMWHTSESEFYDSLAGMTTFTQTQKLVNDQIMEQLKQLKKDMAQMCDRIKALEDVPRNRWNASVNTILQFATLAALGLLVAKIGL